MRFRPERSSIAPVLLFLALCVAFHGAPRAQGSAAGGPAVLHQLLHGSHLIDDCPPCGRPTVVEPMRGRFRWRKTVDQPRFSEYELTGIDFTAGSVIGRTYRITGNGRYTRFHTTPPTQEAVLSVFIDDGINRKLCQFTNSSTAVDRLWPMLDLSLVQTNGTFTQVFHLQVYAAPLHDLWFSTQHGLTASTWNPPTNRITSGDLLSFDGTVEQRHWRLTEPLGLLPVQGDPGLDAVTLSTNAEILFSLERDVFTDRHGWVRHGDLVSESGRLVRRNAELYAAFSPQPDPTPADLGLDAVHQLESGEIYFSTTRDAFSERLGVPIRRGDLLSERGEIIRSQERLLSRFNPPPIPTDYGLDAVFLWPSGEVWFSLEQGFIDRQLGPIGPGDLLSDQGYVVYRNPDLLRPFAPVEDLADFGLDAVAPLPAPRPVPVPPDEPEPLRYRLLDGSRLADELSPGGTIATAIPMRGSFVLQEVEEGALRGRYAVRNLHFEARSPQGRVVTVTGHGTLQRTTGPAGVQDAEFEVLIDDGLERRLCYLTNATTATPRPWPMIYLPLNQANPVVGQYYQLVIAAAPLDDIWFSTKQSFQPGPSAPDPAPMSDGDLLSADGRVVKRNQDLTAALGLPPGATDPGLDAVDLRPGGEIGFSIEEDFPSETLGTVHDGDWVTDQGRIVRYSALLTPFDPEPPLWDQGLDAVHSKDAGNGPIYFSVKRDFDSQALGRRIRRGDLLSNVGLVFRTNEQLLAAFRPRIADRDYGLDAVWIWPSGEIWFSTEDGFLDQDFQIHSAGDLLSDQGYVVYRNRELLFAFAPTDSRLDAGLDAVVVITRPEQAPTPPEIISIVRHAVDGSVTVRWTGLGSVFRVERAPALEAAFTPLTPWIPDHQHRDPSPPESGGYYRVLQW